MLFNSPGFVLFFLPVVIVGFFTLARFAKRRAPTLWLVLMSLAFYGFFKLEYVLLLVGLIFANYIFGQLLFDSSQKGHKRYFLLAFVLVANLGVLAYFKYINFAISTVNGLFEANFLTENVFLPLGISFFTFQNIAYLVDSLQGEREQHSFLDFALFVSFFPQLVAGPIVHHKEMMPQFRKAEVFKFSSINLASGLSLFAIGLAKKILLADQLARWSDRAFALPNPNLMQAWEGALAFTFQIYFDFSGYTDMALGLAMMIGIHLPANFASPYKATNIIEFWRRWHMTLSRFLRDYLYVPLGGNRHGRVRRYVNLLLTMLIGGLWHGAAWTFVFWGALHGIFLALNHAWRGTVSSLNITWTQNYWYKSSCLVVTFLAIVVGWVFFRATSFSGAFDMLSGMIGMNGSETSPIAYLRLSCLLILMLFVWLLPNSQELLAKFHPALDDDVEAARLWPRFRRFGVASGFAQADGSISLSFITGVAVGAVVFLILLLQGLQSTTLQQFIYFQF